MGTASRSLDGAEYHEVYYEDPRSADECFHNFRATVKDLERTILSTRASVERLTQKLADAMTIDDEGHLLESERKDPFDTGRDEDANES